MPSRSSFPGDLIVARRAELRRRGISNARIRTAVRAGRWREPLRGVVVPHAGALTQSERWSAALAYAGPHAVLSHHSALRLWGARARELGIESDRVAGVVGDYAPLPEGGMVEVSVPHGAHMASHGFVVVHQSRRPLGTLEWRDLRLTGAARAAIDVAITAEQRSDVDHVMADVLQRGLATVGQLLEEAWYAGPAVTPWLRAALADVGRGMRSVGESDLRRVVVAAGLPEPEWGARIETAAGVYFVDALWRRKRVAVEADGREYHLSPAHWEADLRRQNAIHGAGVVLFRYPVVRLRDDGPRCGDEMRRLIA
jgi:very-short-patch-repair endonuclease